MIESSMEGSCAYIGDNNVARPPITVYRVLEPQGERVTMGAGGVVYLVGEGRRSGTLASLTCSLC